MKRFTVILVLCILILMPLTAYADIIYEPDNDFYKQYKTQIKDLGRSFAANGEDGSLSVKKEPGAKDDISKLDNGAVTYIRYSCLYNGEFWGFTEEYSGWVKLDQMLVLYDYITFDEEHHDEYYNYSGIYKEIIETRSAIVWPWPGADNYIKRFDNLDAGHYSASYAYMDGDGREWGFVTYIYGYRNVWLCLSEPTNDSIPAFNPAPEPVPWVSKTAYVEISRDEPDSETPYNEINRDAPGIDATILIIIIALVIVLVAVTAVLIRKSWKPNEK